MAPPFQLVGELAAVNCAGVLLGLVEFPADDRTPAPVTARGEVEHEAVGMKLRIGLAAGVVIELSHQKSGGRLPDGAALATPRPGGRPLKMSGGGQDRRLMGLFHRPL